MFQDSIRDWHQKSIARPWICPSVSRDLVSTLVTRFYLDFFQISALSCFSFQLGFELNLRVSLRPCHWSSSSPPYRVPFHSDFIHPFLDFFRFAQISRVNSWSVALCAIGPVHNPQSKCHCTRAVSSDFPLEFHSDLAAAVEFSANCARYPAVFHSPGVAASCKLFRCKEFHCGSLCLQEISLLGSGFILRIGHCICIRTTGCFAPRICSFVCLLIALDFVVLITAHRIASVWLLSAPLG